MADRRLLFTPAALHRAKPRTQIVIAPVRAFAATQGLRDDLASVPFGGSTRTAAGVTCSEATAVAKQARPTHRDPGKAYRQIDLQTKWKHPS